MNETSQTADSHGMPSFRAKPDGTIDPAGEAGWFLQRERERRGLELDIVAQLLGIHQSHLAGIESGDMTRLPSRDEALQMIATYAKYLGYQPEPLIRHYSGFLPLPLPEVRRKRSVPRPLSSAKIIPFSRVLKVAMSSRGLKVVSSIAGVVLMFGAVAAVLQPEPEMEQIARGADSLPTASVQKQVEGGPRVQVTESPLADDQIASLPQAVELFAAPAQPESELGDLGAFITEQLEKPTKDVGVPGPAKTNHMDAPDLKSAILPGANARLVLKATGASVWFRLEDTRGNIVISRTLRRGESFSVPNRDDLTIIARDGGLISYEINGVDQGLLGTPGEIVVGRPLSIAKLLDRRG
jgi:cytoskeleton protein RodZ